MKKKMLSMILAVSMILGNCSSSFVAIAEDGLPTETTTTEASEGTTESSTNEQDTDPTETDDNTQNEDTKTPDENNDPDAQVIVLNVEKIQDITLFKGQNPIDILNYQMANGKPRYSEYFKFHTDDAADVPDEVYGMVSVVDLTDRTTEDNPLSYTIGFKCDENCGYTFDFIDANGNYKIEPTIVLGTDYNPPVTVTKTEDFLYLTCPEEYYISADNENFTSDKVSIESLENKQYYIRNMNQDSVNYLAISQAFTFDALSALELFPIEVRVAENATMLNSAYYTNKDVTINFSCAGQTSMVNMILDWEENGIQKTEKLEPKSTEKNENGKKHFVASYTFKAQENKVTEIKNLRLNVSDVANENDSVERTFSFADNCWALILDTIRPQIDPDWDFMKFEDKNNDPFIFRIVTKDNQSIIKNVDYKLEKDDAWHSVKNEYLYGEQRVDIQVSQSDISNIMYIRVTDVAGNCVYIVRNPNNNKSWWSDNLDEIDEHSSNPPEHTQLNITAVRLFYATDEDPEDDGWTEITKSNVSELHSSQLENAINKKWLRIAIVSDSDDTFYLKRTGNDVKLKTKKSDEGEIEYYYYDIAAGSSCNMVISSGRQGGTEIAYWADKFPDGSSIQSSLFIVDDTKASAILDNPTPASGTTNWYGISEKDGEIKITVSDGDNGSGLNSIKITDSGAHIKSNQAEKPIQVHPDNDGQGVALTELPTNGLLFNDRLTKNVTVSIPLSCFDNKDGEHTLRIIIEDNAGNRTTGFAQINDVENTDYVFNTDYSAPDGTLEFLTTGDGVVKPTPCIVNGETTYWYNGIEVQKETAWFQIKSNSGENPNYANCFITDASGRKYSQTKYFNEDGIVIFSDNDENMKVDLPKEGEDHYYTVEVEIVDKAGNSSRLISSETAKLQPLKYYRDCKIPVIRNVSVNKTEAPIEKVLRILTFGLYSNDDIKITVEIEEPDNDSGLTDDSVEIRFSEDGSIVESIQRKDNIYSCILSSDDPSLTGKIFIKVTDQFGLKSEQVCHISEDYEEIHGTKEEPLFTIGIDKTDSHEFMLDHVDPIITTSKLISDGVQRQDGTIWFKDNHDLEIHVSDEHAGLFEVRIYVNGVTVDSEGQSIYDESRKLIQDSGSSLDSSVASQPILTEDMSVNIDNAKNVFHDVDYILSSDKIDSSYHAQDGHYIITVVAEDYAGNKVVSNELDYYVDKEAPKVDSIILTPQTEDKYGNTSDYPFDVDDERLKEFVGENGQFLIVPENGMDIQEYGFYFRDAFHATVNVSDAKPTSGLRQITYQFIKYENGRLIETGTLQYADIKSNDNDEEHGQAEFDIPAGFKGQIYVNVEDNVGNIPNNDVTPHSFVSDTPQLHESESHIKITGFGDTTYRDGEGHPLFDSNVSLTVKISDTMSGVRQITYDLTSEKNTSDKKVIDIANTGNAIGKELGDGWTITAMDENLVTEITRAYQFSADDNNIQLIFEMTDRSNNTTPKESEIFSIDQTAPVINVVFGNAAGNGEYYSEARTATITVTERNFDPNKIIASITNDIGGVPALSFTENSNTEHIGTMTFGEGDYTFGIEGTDLCNHTATVNYSGGNEKNFHVDLTDPVVVNNYNEFINDVENSFNSNKEMTFSVTEHNFNPQTVVIRIYRAPAGRELTEGNREDCTADYVKDNMWTSNGDTHNTSFTFSQDYVYQVSITVTDKSGRTPATATSPVFEIDKTKPVLKTPVNLEKLVYNKKSTQTEADSIVFEDSNIDKISYSVVSYQMERNEDNVGYDMKVSDPKKFEVKTDSVVISDDYFKSDGIYEVKSVAYDVAGNASDESTHTFVIQRDTDFLVYIPDSNKEKQTGLYKFNEKGIRSADFDDIEIISYITEDKTLGVRVGDEDVTGDDISVKELKGSDLGGDKKNDETINQVTAYDLTLKNSFIAQNYDADTIDTDLLLNAVASTEDSQQVITLGHIYIDNVKPVGEYEDALQDLGLFDGFYGMESRSVLIEGVSPDIDVDRCEILANDLTLKAEDGGFVYDANTHTISFTINKGYTDIRPTLVDKAGNINNLPLVKKVYVGGLFARFWYLFILGGLLILAIPTFIIMALVKKKSRPAFK